jgi:sterol desaturase/sphingolipid hydroxylase (fatty acid hydroxylase superfamily)
MNLAGVDPEILLRLSFMAATFAAMASWEYALPRRARVLTRRRRWPGNLALIALGTILVRVVAPVTLVGIAEVRQGAGLLAAAGLTGIAGDLAGFILLDLTIYAQHVVFHHVPVLWRLHRTHHADLDLDVTTGLRFHPLEILISYAVKAVVIALSGVSPWVVIAFEVVLNALALFNHANVSLPPALEKLLRLVIVTPEMHEVHHSRVPRDLNSNFGFNFSFWDRLFRTFAQAPAQAEEAVVIGIDRFRAAGEARLDRLLTQPFREEKPGVRGAQPGR